MFQTKQEVDKHISNSLKRIDNNTDRDLRCYAWAKLYYDVGEYASAVHYVHSYLRVKPKSAEAHNLLGQALEKLGKNGAALEAYKTSLHQDSNQPRIVIKVCELISQDDVEVDMPVARYFCDLAQSIDPNSTTISSLREKIIMNESKDPQEVLRFLKKEIENKPNDVTLRIKQLQHFIKNKMILEAYNHASSVEEKNVNAFRNNSLWYETFATVLMEYQKDANLKSQLTWEFWFQSASVLEKLSSLSLDDYLGVDQYRLDYINPVFNFDQFLYNARQNIDNCPDKVLVKEFLSHYEAQLCFHFCVLAFKQAKSGFIQFKKVRNLILPLLFIAYNTSPSDLQSLWFHSVTANWRKIIISWHKTASFRCSQTGHLLRVLMKDNTDISLAKFKNSLSSSWREGVFKQIFVKRNQQIKSSSSFFVHSCVVPTWDLPEVISLRKYDEIAQEAYPDSLHHYIWLAMNCSKLSHFNLKTFETLPFTVNDFNNCSVETLSKLDVLAFIYCATLCAQDRLANKDSSLSYFSEDRPEILPVSITAFLTTSNRAKFLDSAYKMYTKDQSATMGEARQIVLKGIEVIRCVGNHGLDVKILVELANTFAERAEVSDNQINIDANNHRAERYWNAALPLLERINNNYPIVYPKNRMFELSSNKELSKEEAAKYIEKAQLFLGHQLLKKKDYEKALTTFEKLKDPYASYYQSLIYKSMAEIDNNERLLNQAEMKSDNSLLLSRALDCLYVTLDRLKHPNQDRDHPLNLHLGTEIERLEYLVSECDDTDCLNRRECDGTSDEESQNKQVLDYYLNISDMNKSMQQRQAILHQSTPTRRQEARPSAERLDAQLRQLVLSKDLTANNMIEQNKMMTELQKFLIDEVKGFKEAVNTLTSTVQDQAKLFRMYCEDVKEVKGTVNNLTQNVDDKLQNVADMVQEMRKEINEIKRDQNKVTQLNDEDLYVLDSEYNSTLDYNLDTTPSVNVPPPLGNAYGSYAPRLAPHPNTAPPIPPNFPPPAPHVFPGYPGQAPWTGSYYPWNYPYGNLGMPPPHLLTSEHQQLSHHLNHLTATGSLPASQPLQPPPPSFNFALGTGITTTQIQPSIPSPATKDNTKTTKTSLPGINSSACSKSDMGMTTTYNTAGAAANLEISGISTPINKTQFPLTVVSNTSSVTSVPTTVSTTPSFSANKLAPVNVVITSSDPLPNITIASTKPQVLSVTIPPQHIKGNIPKSTKIQSTTSQQQPHLFQIPLPDPPVTSSLFNNLSHTTFTASMQSVPTPSFSFSRVSASEGSSMQPNKDVSLDNNSKLSSNLNVSNVSNSSVDEYDPRPDFQPIVPLPAEVTVTTGEENEIELFCQRAKLFRYVNSGQVKEWKERGVGNLKFLFHPETKRVRIIMRRDHVHKVCANHFVTKEMTLTQMKNTNAYIWAALDFADGEQVLEKFCARFKTEEESKKFAEQFEKAKQMIEDPMFKTTVTTTTSTPTPTPIPITVSKSVVEPVPPANLGGFKFTSVPTFKPVEESKTPLKTNEPKVEVAQSSPFASFTFSSQLNSNTQSSQFANLFPSNKPEEGLRKDQKNQNSWNQTSWKPPAKDSWKCNECDVVNATDKKACVCCGTTREGESKQDSNKFVPFSTGIDLNSTGQKFNFGIPKIAAAAPQNFEPPQTVTPSLPAKNETSTVIPSNGFKDLFKPKPNSWNCKTCYVVNDSSGTQCVCCGTPQDSSDVKQVSVASSVGNVFNFGYSTPSTVSSSVPSSVPQPLNTSKIGSNVSQGDTLESLLNKPIDNNIFGATPLKFDFEFKPKSPKRVTNEVQDESDNSVEEEEPNVYFKPVIPLPDKIEVVTGEENHEVLFCHRAKLFRFCNGEWKERGVGDVKILKDNATKKLRVVMRRDHIWKICLNHLLNDQIQYLAKDEKTWLFSAIDFTDGEAQRYQFCIRFKNHEIAEDFKKAADTAVAALNSEVKPVLLYDDDDDEVEIVSETEVTAEEEQEAIRLGLPPKYMSYKQLPDCKCQQCKADDEYLKEFFGNKSVQAEIENVGKASSFSTPNKLMFNSSINSSSNSPSASFVSALQSPLTFTPVQNTTCIKELLQNRAISITPVTSATKSNSPSVNWCSANEDQDSTVEITEISNQVTPINISGVDKDVSGILKSTTSSNIFAFSSKSNLPSKIEIAKPDGEMGMFRTPTSTITQTPFALEQQKNKSNTSISDNLAPNFNLKLDASSQNPLSELKSNNIFASGLVSSASSVVTNSGANILDPRTNNIFRTPSSSSSSSILRPSILSNANTNIFGGSTFTSTTTTATIFPRMNTSNIFAKSNSPMVGNIFQITPNLNSSTSSNTSIFSVSKSDTNNPATTTVAVISTTTTTTTTTTTGSIFGGNSSNFGSTNVFNVGTMSYTTGSIFGQPLLGDKPKLNVTEANLTFGSSNIIRKEPVNNDIGQILKCDSSLNFGDLAAQANNPISFGANTGDKKSFAYLGAGAPVFGSTILESTDSTARNHSMDEKQTDASLEEVHNDHDPHFEPIVALPDEIVVNTGEEDDTIVFQEKATLFRFDSKLKQWKERGVGDIKILFNPESKVYRLLMRRDLVHKTVLNQRLTSNFELKSGSSEKAWIWAGLNYIDNESQLESLAVRFKNVDLAMKFKQSIQESIKKLSLLMESAQLNSEDGSLNTYSDTKDIQTRLDEGDNEEDLEEEEEEGDDDDIDEEDLDEEYDYNLGIRKKSSPYEIMFVNRCTLSEEIISENSGQTSWKQIGTGDLELSCEPNICGYQITFKTVDGDILSKTVIEPNTVMKWENENCIWTGVKEANNDNGYAHRNFKATFDNIDLANEFYENYMTCAEIAREDVDTDPNESD